MRMRTQAEAMTAIREADPDTALTPHMLRHKILSGEIPSVQAGRKRLIDLDRLEEYLAPTAPAPIPIKAGIRPVAE